jgi:4-amino-4-deoxy-L-arabinose transferase-like glycosyltransferase
MDIAVLIGLAGFVFAAIRIMRFMSPRDPLATVVIVSNVFVAFLVAAGFALSAFGKLSSSTCWMLVGTTFGGVSYGLSRYLSIPTSHSWKPARVDSSLLDTFFGRMLGACLATTASIIAIDIIVIVFSAPGNADSMTYHLARAAYYLQQGSLNWYPANFYAQVQWAKIASVLNVVMFLLGSGDEKYAQFIQFFAYLITGALIYLICRRVGMGQRPSLMAMVIFMLSTNVLMESTTTQNDLIVLWFVASALFFFIEYWQTEQFAYAFFFGVTIGLAVGTKASALMLLPPLLVVMVAVGMVEKKLYFAGTLRVSALLALTLTLGLAVFAAPAGYFENWVRYGNVLGSPYLLTQVTFSGMEITKRLSSTIANFARFTVDLSRLDGLPNQVTDLTRYLSYGLQLGFNWLLRGVGIDMVSSPTRWPYELAPNLFDSIIHEDLSYFGPLGPLLMYPAIVIGMIRRRDILFWAFALASLCFLVCQAAAGPYDPWRGRFFTGMLLFMAPAAALVAGDPRRQVSVALVSLVLMIAVMSGLNSIINRQNSSVTAILSMSRIAQLTRNRPTVRQAVENYERMVPPGSHVLSILQADSYEFPFFGEKLNRHLIPGGNWPNIQTEDFPRYVLFNGELLPKGCDFVLGGGYRLRDTEICR